MIVPDLELTGSMWIEPGSHQPAPAAFFSTKCFELSKARVTLKCEFVPSVLELGDETGRDPDYKNSASGAVRIFAERDTAQRPVLDRVHRDSLNSGADRAHA